MTKMDYMFRGATAMTHPVPSVKEAQQCASNFFESVADQNQR